MQTTARQTEAQAIEAATPPAFSCVHSAAPLSTQSSPARPTPTALQSESEGADLWGDWPYCWAIDLHEYASERFHWFHTNLIEWRLQRHNRAVRTRFQSAYWQEWQNEDSADAAPVPLRIV